MQWRRWKGRKTDIIIIRHSLIIQVGEQKVAHGKYIGEWKPNEGLVSREKNLNCSKLQPTDIVSAGIRTEDKEQKKVESVELCKSGFFFRETWSRTELQEEDKIHYNPLSAVRNRCTLLINRTDGRTDGLNDLWLSFSLSLAASLGTV